jgi:hypothetical protein
VKDGIPYAIDFMNPAPDMDVNSLTPHYFDWVVTKMADMAIRLAKEARPQEREPRWNHFLRGRKTGFSGALGGASDADGAGDLAEELPSLAQGLTRRS